MKITSATPITFKYKHMLKTYWLEGKLPRVTHGIYGGELTKDTVTLEHLKPHSKGGRTILGNLALSKNTNNWARSNKPLSDFFNQEAFDGYCEGFKGVKLPFFNGDEYIKQITKTIGRLLKAGQ